MSLDDAVDGGDNGDCIEDAIAVSDDDNEDKVVILLDEETEEEFDCNDSRSNVVVKLAFMASTFSGKFRESLYPQSQILQNITGRWKR